MATHRHNKGSSALYYSGSSYTTWKHGLHCKLFEWEFSTCTIKLISSFLSQRKIRVSVQGEMPTPRYVQGGVPQGSALLPTLRQGMCKEEYRKVLSCPPHYAKVYARRGTARFCPAPHTTPRYMQGGVKRSRAIFVCVEFR
jgi:hypothetical protein